MIDVPALGGDVSAAEAVMAVAIFAAGYVLHETLHVLPLRYWGYDYELTLVPLAGAGVDWVALLGGTVVRITVVDSPPRWRMAVCALAPAALVPFPLAGIALALSRPVVDIGTMLVLFAWFAVSLPSPVDWLTAVTYRPGAGAGVGEEKGLVADG